MVFRELPCRLVAVLLLAAVAPATGGPADPEPVADASWIRALGRQRQALARDDVDLCFIGDSLTEFWAATGKPVWDLEFHDRACVNLGLAGDRTEHILHRLSRLDFARSKPKTTGLTLDGTHLSLAGYDRLAHQLAPALKGQRADDPVPPP